MIKVKTSGFFRKVISLVLVAAMTMTMLGSSLFVLAEELASDSLESSEISEEGEVITGQTTENDVTDVNEQDSGDESVQSTDTEPVSENENEETKLLLTNDELGNDTEYVSVSTADELETAIENGGAICIAADFELDRTFYITQNTYIYSDAAHVLTRNADFGGDIFVVGEYSDGTMCENTVAFSLGHPESVESDLLTIDGNGDYMSVDVTGTVVFVCNNAQVDFYENLTLTNNKKLGNERTLDEKYGVSYPDQIGGAAVILASGTLNVYGAKFTNNIVHDVEGEASSRGGAIYSFGTLNIYGADFDSNSAARGGAIYSYKSTNIYNASITNNVASYRGGAIYMPENATAVMNLGGDNDIIEGNVIFEGNSAESHGGAIFVKGTLSAKNTSFIDNVTQVCGGALYVSGKLTDGKTVRVSDSVFTGNRAETNGGGAIYLTDCTAEFNNTEFTGNVTATHGGAIYAKDLVDEENALTVSDSVFAENTATKNAGAIYINNTKVSIAGSDFSKNTSGDVNGGGAVYSTKGTVSMTETDFTENTTETMGGAVYFNTTTEAVLDKVTFTGNTASGNGGAVAIGGGSNAVASNITATGNSGTAGGFLYSTGATLKMYTGNLSQNTATKGGGAVYFDEASTAEMSTVTFAENVAEADNGGAVKLDKGSTVVMNNITAEKNSSKAAGFLFNYGSVLNLYNSTISENAATAGNAGALYSAQGSSSNIYKTKFTKNSATGNGGALYMYTDTVESIIHSCTFSENTSANFGGAMYASGKSVLQMYNTIATDNSAGHGGFLYETTTATTVTIAGLTVSGNTATVGGPIIWGNLKASVLNIDKEKYFDVDNTGELDDSYWAGAIVNLLTVNNLSVDIPDYDDYEGEDGEEGDTPSEPEEKVTINIKSSSQLEQAIGTGFTTFRIVEDFELDRTFYITEDTYIFSDEAHTLTRKADFAGDIFVVGESAKGTFTENPVTLTFGNPKSESENLLVIDGNKDNLSVNVTGTVFFIGNNSTVDLHKVTVRNNKKLGNVRTLDEKYSASYPEQIGGAAVIIDSGTLNIYGATLSNNIVHDIEGEASSRGGAIYSFGTLNIYGATISENSAARGGAIYSYKTTNIYNASITKNHASYRGGAIYMPASVNSRLNLGIANEIIKAEVLFEENSSADNGGAIFDQGVLNANNTTFLKNTSVKAGGAIAAYGIENLGDNKSIVASNSVFDQNTSAGGGAVALYSNATAMFSNASFTKNTSTSTGGAVVADSADVKVYGSTFENNTASSHGGALMASEEANVYMSNVKLNGNSSGANGGAAYATASKIEIDGAEVKNNSSVKYGGAFSMHRATATGIVSELTFNKITASGNTAGDLGGFLYNNHSVLKIYNSEIKDSYSASHGGAICLQGVADTSIYNTKFINNSCGTEAAVKNGGAMYVYTTATNTLLHSCTFDGNSSTNYGGGLYVSNGTLLTMYNTTAKNNTAPKGGFMYETTTGTVATISGLTVSGNTAPDGGPIIWGNTTNAKLRINKNNYTDLDHTGEYDSTYWASAIVNKLTVEEISDEVPRYQDYNNELYDEFDEVMDVTSASELEFAINSGVKNIRIVESFEIDRTFYVTGEVVIFTTASKTLTRKADFAGDIFVVGEDAEGNSSISLGKTAKLTLGNQYSETADLLIIDGNSENMTVGVTGTVIFLEESGQVALYKNTTIQNNRKKGNERILNEKYLLNNASRVGGAAMIISDGTVNIYGATLKNNICNEETTGEGVPESARDSSLGGAIYNRGTFNIHSGLFEGNQSARGGVMYNIKDLYVYGGQFIGNHATTNGGAIYLAGSQFSQMYAGDQLNSKVSDKILFKNNTSVSNGGAMYCASMAIAMIYGDTTFEGNATASNGGAIASYGMVDTNNVVFKDNFAYSMGGGAYVANSNEELVTRIVTFENTLFENNTARNGGAVAVYASNEELSEGGILEVQKCNFIKNKAVNTKDTEVTSNVFGGAIYITRKSTLNIADTNFEENEALFEGGAIYAAGESETTVTGSTFTKNKTAHESDAKGGAVSVHSATLDFDNATFTENSTCKNGGAVYVSYTTALPVNSDVNIKNSNFGKNSAGNAGGAIYVTKHAVETQEDEIVNIKNTSFSENTAALGGAAYFTAYSDAYMKDVAFTKNTASSTTVNSYGGAIYLTNSAVAEIDGAQFTDNSSTYCSGGISLHSSARAILNNITATGNNAPTSAGFMYVNSARVDVYSSEIKGNSAGVNGGAIAMYNSAVANLNNTVFDGNTAEGYGGAIYNTTSEAESVFHTCTFKNNVSPKFGGAMFVNNKALLKMYNLVAENNSAQKGGVLYETTTDTEVTINTMTVKGNAATEEGPIIFGNTYKAILNIHKINYTDEDMPNTADDSYWDYAIENELTVNDMSGVEDEIPECDTYVPKTEEEEEEKERIPVPVDDVLSLGLNSSDGVISTAYGKLPKLDTSSNFMSRSTTVFPDINGKDVTVDTFVSHAGDPANNCTVGEGILLYQSILYKQAHPEEEVNISIASFRFSALAAVNINRNSRYFGYMRNLPNADYDKYGFVRLSYLLVTAAKMGINVTVVGQLDGYPQPSSAPTLYEYFTYYLDEPCDPAYAEGKFVRDYMTFGYCEWTSYDNKAATDMMHTKMCAVSHYLDMNGNTGRNAVWSSSSNLDGINSNATNGNNKMQTATIVSNHEEIYRAAYNYINIIPEYCGQEEVYNFRTLVADISKNQIDLIEAGRADEIKPEEQIVYLGTENDDVFEFYFSPFGGDVMTWTESYNPYCKFARKFSNSDDYVIMSWNSANYNKSTPIVLQIEEMLTNTFLTKKNPNNRIYTNLEDFDTAPYKNLVLGQDIGLKSFNKYDHGALHSKDLQLSYSENGKREYVSILSSINMHGGAMSYQSNYVLVIKEDNCNEDSVFFNIADQTSVGVVEHTYGEEKTFFPENENEDGYTYVECEFCDKKVIGGTVHRLGEWTVAKESTATENGISYLECKGCGEVIAAKETVGKESKVTYTEGIKFSKNTTSRIPVRLSAMPLTFEAMISIPKTFTSRPGVIVSNYEKTRENLVCFEVLAGGKVRLYYRNNSIIQDCIFAKDIRSKAPKHIAVTVDENIATLYVDGEAVESKTLTVEYPSEYNNMYVGGDDRAKNTQYFKGTIYSAAIFGDVRTAEEIKADAVFVPETGDNLLYSETYLLEKEEPEKVVTENTVIHPEAIDFDVSESYSIGTLSQTPHTFEAVLSVPTDYNERAGVVVSNYNGGTDPQIAIEIYEKGRPRVFAYTGSARVDTVFDTDIRSEVPRHMAITVDGKKATLYLDGEAVETKTLRYALPETTERFKVGGDDRSENSQYFKGEILSVVLFGDVRTAEEIKSDAMLVTADEDDLVYSGYFTEKNSKYVLMPTKGSIFTKDNAKAIPKYINTPHTFDAVIKLPLDIEGRGGVIAGNYSRGEKNVASFEVYENGKARLYYSNKSVVESCVFDTDVRSDKPVRVTVTVEETTATLYINGEAVETKTLTVPYPQTIEDLKIGGDNRSGNGQYFKGTIYATAIYEEVLRNEDIKKGILYNCENAIYSALLTTETQLQVSGEGKTFSTNTKTLVPIDINEVPLTYEAVINVPEDIEGRAGVIVGNYKLNRTKVLSFEVFDGGRVRLYGKTGVKNQSIDCTFDTDIRSNKPVHIAITVDGLNATLYINGVQTETKTLQYELSDDASDLKIGGDNRKGNVQYFKGTIYSVALFSDIRTAEEIALDVKGVPNDADAVLYNTDFTEEICTESTTGGKHIEGDWIIDRTPSESQTGLKHTECTTCGIVLSTKEYVSSDEAGVSVDFTNPGAGLKLSSVADAVSAGDFEQTPRTFEALFILPKSYTNRAGTLVGNYDGGTGEQINVEIYNNGKPRLYYKNSRGKAYTYLFATDVRSSSITHLAITVDGSNALLYLNGDLKETVTINSEYANTASDFVIGADNRTASPQYFKGTIYGVNIFGDVRSAQEIKLDRFIVPSSTQGLVYSKYFVD